MMPLNTGTMLLEDNSKDLRGNIFISPRNELDL